VSGVALATAVARSDVDHHTGDGDRRGECRYRKKQTVVGEYRDVGVSGHAWAVGWSSASVPEASLRLIRPAPQLRPPMRTSVQNRTTKQPVVHS
jgi:hypothetical protein